LGNIYRLNPFYEWELECFPSSFQTSQGLNIKSKSLEYLFAGILKTNDLLFLSHKPDFRFLNYLEKKFQREIKVTNDLNPDYELIEWGKFYKTQDNKLQPDTHIINKHKLISSKLYQDRFRQKHLSNCPKRFSVKNFKDCIDFSKNYGFPFLLKPDLGLSGVLSWVVNSETSLIDKKDQIENAIQSRTYFIEAWKRRIADFSGLFDSHSGLINITKMHVNEKGVYKGSETLHDLAIGKLFFNTLVSLRKENILPEGAFSIDGFSYKEDQEEKICLLSEINARWTMGRLHLELESKSPFKKTKLEFIPNLWKIIDDLEKIENSIKYTYNSEKITILTPPFLESQKIASIGILIEYQ
jgi:hypothetical protein